MSNSEMGRKLFGLYPDHFCNFRILSGYPIFTNSVYTLFTTMCVVVTMNLLNPLSKYGLVCSYELVCEVVNYYRSLQLLVYYHLSIVFMYSCRVCWMIG